MDSPTTSPQTASPLVALVRDLLRADAWTIERALFFIGFAIFAVSPIPFALDVGLDLLFGPQALSAAPAMGLAALALLTRKPWAHLAAAVASLAPVVFVIGYTTRGAVILNPLVGAEFASQALLSASVLLIVPASLFVFFRARTGAGTPLRVGLRSRQAAVALGVVALATGAVAAGALAADRASAVQTGGGLGFEPDERVTLGMTELAFTPGTLKIPAGAVVEVVLVNEGGAHHTFAYELDGRTYDHEVPAGGTASVLLKVDEPGAIPFRCTPHAYKTPRGYTGMVGVIVAE